MTKYVNIRTYKKGVKRDSGIGRHCILSYCHTDATVKADKLHGGKRMEVALCGGHATQIGIV